MKFSIYFKYIKPLSWIIFFCIPVAGLQAQVSNLNKPVIAVTQPPVPGSGVVINPTPVAYPAGALVNYVRTWEAIGPLTDAATFTTQAYTAVKQTTTYIDGLGRPLQTVMKQITPGNSPTDMVSPVIYDAFGRETFKYMPYISSAIDGNFKTDPFTQQKTFLQTQYPGEQVFYNKTDYEASPLNRPVKVYAQGNSWAGNNIGIEQQYLINTLANDVKIWGIGYDINDFNNNVPAIEVNTYPAGVYPAGELYQNKTIDENGNEVVEFKDKEGKVILKKVQVNAGITEAYTGWLCTYYVYDDLNRLRFVIPPKAVAWLQLNAWSFTAGTDVVNELCFRYEYDYRNRMIAKKAPGAGWVYMVYDRRDRMVFTQDANLRINKKWMANLYDDLNRPVLTGMITYNVSGTDNAARAALQSDVNTVINAGTGGAGVSISTAPPSAIAGDITVNSLQQNTRHYKASNSITMDVGFDSDNSSNVTLEIVTTPPVPPVNQTIGVNDNPLRPSYNFIALTETFYDNYTFNTNPAATYTPPAQPLTAGAALYPVTTPSVSAQALVPVKGMVTGTRVRTLPDPANLAAGVWLSSVIFYDERGRVLQTFSENYKGGTDKATNLYNFTGAVLCSRLEHNNPQNPEAALQQITVQTNISYDHAGRVMQVDKSVNGATAKTIAKNNYNALGQLITKELGKAASGSPVETLDYTYNIRGWLKGINKDYAITASNTYRYFGMELNYDWGFAGNQYNGNIAGTKWRSKGDDVQRSYGFGYDKVNRLVSADFAQGASYADDPAVNFDMNMGTFAANNYVDGSGYDENGNIKRMQQWGLQINSSIQIDDLNYTYSFNESTQTNKLLNVIDKFNVETTKLGDFRTSASHPDKIAKTNASTNPLLITDYSYDVIGNLISDLNKDIEISAGAAQGIQYNHLNLPWKINVKNKGTITYIYDAAGNKLEKITNDITAPPVGASGGNKVTGYMSGFVYENDVLQFFAQEEGRVRVVPSLTGGASTFAFDYFIKDHLGNVRMVLTEEVQIDHYPTATLEGAGAESPASKEQNYYDINTAYIVDKPLSYTNDNGTNNPATFGDKNASSQKMYKLNGATNRTGLGMVLKVMANGKIDILGKSNHKYNSAMPAGGTQFTANELISAFLGVMGGANAAVNHGASIPLLSSNTNGTVVPLEMLSGLRDMNANMKVKAAINYIFFDEQFNFAGSGYDLVSTNVGGGIKQHFLQNIPVPKNGYIYIYCSNESNIDAFFDNLEVVHTRGAILEETHYYPFGLTMAGISSKAAGSLINKKGYNGNEIQNKEFSDGSGLELYDFNARTYDQQVGRFIQIDPTPEDGDQESLTPYHFSGNNPSTFNDPNGKCPWCWGAIIGAAVEYGTQVAGNLVQGKSLGESLTDVKGGQILIAAVAGGLSGGVSAFVPKTTAAKVVVEGVKIAIDAGESAAKQYNETGKVSGMKVLTDVGANKVAGELTKNVKANNNIGTTKSNLDRAQRIAKNDPVSSGRAATVKKLESKVSSQKAANQSVQQAASGAVSNTLQASADAVNKTTNVPVASPGYSSRAATDHTTVKPILRIRIRF